MKTGAVSPSSPALAEMMARMVEPGRQGPIVELGPGTGVVTQALIERGILPSRLILIEYNSDFCRLLKKRFPAVNIIRGDAYNLAATLQTVEVGTLASIVSSLPLLTRSTALRHQLVETGLNLLAQDAPFVQFSYGLTPPVAEELGAFSVSRSGWVVKNIPPARVWTYRRHRR